MARRLAGPAIVVAAIVAGQLVGLVFGDDGWPFVPFAVQIGLALVFGSLSALVAVGLILIYRASRIINFAQSAFGVLAGIFHLLLMSRWGFPFWLAVPTALVAIGAAGLVVEVMVVRRFARSPRLVLTIVTLAVAQLLASIAVLAPRWVGYAPLPEDETGLASYPARPPKTPFADWTFNWSPVVFRAGHVLTFVIAIIAMVGLAWFLGRSAAGVAVRGAAENSSRAELLGVSSNTLSTMVWVIGAVLAGVGGVLITVVQVQSVRTAAATAVITASASGLLRALTAAVIARMEDMVVAVAAAIGIAIFEQSVFWATRDTAIVSAVLLVTIVAALAVQRRGSSRIDATETSTWEATEEVRGVPAELATLPQVRRGLRRALWTGVLIVLAYPWLMSPSQTNTGALYAIFGMIGVSLVILTGWAGQISLGQFGFVAVGAVVGSAVTAGVGLPFPVGALAGSAAAGAVAVVIGIPAMRIKGLFLAVTTLAFALVSATVVVNGRYFGWLLPDGPIRRPSFLGINTDADERSFYYLTVACLVGVLYLAQGLRTSRTGRILIGLRDNDRAAQAYGVNLLRTQIIAFGISGAIAGFAGVLFAYHQTVLDPSLFSPDRSVSIFLMSVLGGLGSVYAVLAGAIYFATTTVVISGAAGQLLATAGGVLLVLLFFPTGIGSLVFRGRDAWLRRIAQRNRIWVPTLMGDRAKTGEDARAPIAPRLVEQGAIPEYRLESDIGETGKSQLTKLWRY